MSFASCVNAWKPFVPPAIWNDGQTPGGIPEGAILQLDPGLDLSRFPLSSAARTIARAMQEYGLVDVDSGGGAAVYAELLIDRGERTWRGLLTDQDMLAIPFRHFRVLRMEGVVNKGYEWRS